MNKRIRKKKADHKNRKAVFDIIIKFLKLVADKNEYSEIYNKSENR